MNVGGDCDVRCDTHHPVTTASDVVPHFVRSEQDDVFAVVAYAPLVGDGGDKVFLACFSMYNASHSYVEVHGL